MNDKFEKWAMAGILLICFGVVAWAPTLYAQSPPVTDYSHIDKEMAVNCSAKSIGISKKWMVQSAKTAQQMNNGMMSTPMMRLQAQTNKLLATAGYERLISECAMWRLAGGGSV